MDFKGKFKAFFSDNSNIDNPEDAKLDLLVAFCTPTLDGNCHYSRTHVWSMTSLHIRYVMNVIGENTYLDYGRNRVVTIAKEKAVERFGRLPDYYLWLDQDNVFPPKLFMDLYLHDKDIVSASYARKTNWDWCFKPTNEYKDWENRRESLKDGLIECRYIGFGAVLIKGRVFEEIPVPWFKQDTQWVKHNGQRMIHEVGEDVWFCDRAREKGYKVYVDVNCHVGHTGATVWPEDAYAMHKLKESPGHVKYEGNIGAKDPVLVK
jgi:hypothetical protein